jgi:histone acetyltransferase (RNA polymerase elongator complex component)
VKKKHYTIPIFIPELACPFQCVFCDQKKISGYSKIPSEIEVRKTIDSYLRTFSGKDTVINIGFFGGNFTGIPFHDQEVYLQTASFYLNRGDVQGIRLSTRPDYINNEVVDLLKHYSVSTVELGAQSFNDDVLKKSGRGHNVSDIIEASRLIKNSGIQLGLQMMIGLPGDSLDKSLFTANQIINLGAGNTRIYPTVVIKGTKLEQLFHAGKYSPLSLTEAVEWTKKILLAFYNSGVDVIRVGLHPSEGLLTGEDLAAGPFHVSFKELVLTNIWSDLLFERLKYNNGNILIKIPADQINYAIGYKASNKKMLLEKFNSVRFIPDPSLNNHEFNVIYS